MALCSSHRTLSASPGLIYVFAFVCLAACLPTVSAFGSGKIPDAAYLKGKAWRHGDIDDVIEGLVKVAGQGGSAIIGAIASAFFSEGSGQSEGRGRGGKKFSGLDVKRVYFGNWLRDLSQVCDIAGFKAMTAESLVICIMTMGFLTFGYATREFQVTRERLAVYLLTEHIDNPKGYGEGEDPQSYDPRLRPQVDEYRELAIDERNGMKKYIASDDEDFDTSTKCIRRTFKQCIQVGREARVENNEDKEHESLRLLGTGLHTLEDFSAHSNWCELALQKLGHKQVFAHVGENVKVNSPDGPVPPLTTGTFAGADFCFSMLGEASDKLSSASIADLTAQLDDAQNENQKPDGGKFDFIKSVLTKLPLGGGGGSQKVDDGLNDIEQKKKAFDLDGEIDRIAPEDLQQKLWELFVTRDNLMRRVEEIIEGVPGLGELLENLSLALTQWIMIIIDPYVRPILLQASTAIGQGSQAVISGNDQWTVFNDPDASDPTHSVLAKDHFSNILNDPAGNISVIIVKNTVNLIVDAWSNEEDADRVIDQILEAIHHPSFASQDSHIQIQMMDYMKRWLGKMDADDRELTLNSLTKDSIRNHRNQRKTSENGIDPRIADGQPLRDSSHQHSNVRQRQTTFNGQELYTSGRKDVYSNVQQQSSCRPGNAGARDEAYSQSGHKISRPAKSSQYGRDASDETDKYSRDSQGARQDRQDAHQNDLQGEQYGRTQDRAEYPGTGQQFLFESSPTYRPSDDQDRGGARHRQERSQEFGGYGTAYQGEAQMNQNVDGDNSYRASGRHELTYESERVRDHHSYHQEKHAAYTEPAYTAASSYETGADEGNSYGGDIPRYSQEGGDNNYLYAHSQHRNNETQTYRLSGQDKECSANPFGDELDGNADRTPAYASMPPESYGHIRQESDHQNDGLPREPGQQYKHCSNSYGRDKSDKYVKSRHERKHSTDSKSSKDSDKKGHSKSKHKHKSKSKSRSRERNANQQHGQKSHDQPQEYTQRDSDYGMNQLNMGSSSRSPYDYE